jgi:tellurite resistance protein
MGTTEFSALWASFRGKGGAERDRVIVGVAAAFAHVAVANGVLEAAEVRRFLDVVRGSRLANADDATSRQLGDAFEALTHALLTRPAAGRQECLQVLSDFGFDPTRSEIIWSATRAALVADAGLDPAERRAEAEIREALRIRVARR